MSLTVDQVALADNVMSSKAYPKERFAYECRRRIADGTALTIQQIQQLLENRSYFTIELALEKRFITREGLALLAAPYTGTKDKKHRNRLARKARELNDEHADDVN